MKPYYEHGGKQSLKAGRELDCAIAEEVMGFHEPHQTRFAPDLWIHSGMFTVPFYSTDIAAAWDVLKKMEEPRGGFVCGLSVVIGTNACAPGKQVGVKFYNGIHGVSHSIFDAEPHRGFYRVGDSVPECICLAALDAVRFAALKAVVKRP